MRRRQISPLINMMHLQPTQSKPVNNRRADLREKRPVRLLEPVPFAGHIEIRMQHFVEDAAPCLLSGARCVDRQTDAQLRAAGSTRVVGWLCGRFAGETAWCVGHGFPADEHVIAEMAIEEDGV